MPFLGIENSSQILKKFNTFEIWQVMSKPIELPKECIFRHLSTILSNFREVFT